jgi:hypothetical protein
LNIKKNVRNAKKPGVLVPLVNKFMTECAVEIETEADCEFLRQLMLKTMKREEMRREGPRYFSPSSLGEPCIRKAYLSRHAVKVPGAPSPYGLSAHYYFLTGNFLHLKWQFAFYKMEQWIGNSTIFKVHGYEIPVTSKRGDHRGTIDVVASIYNEPWIIDIKGLNSFSAHKVGLGRISKSYQMQLTDYLVLWNSQKDKPFEINRSLLFVEDKGWVESSKVSPIQEMVVPGNPKLVQRRLKRLRDYEARGQIPNPRCKSLKDKNFVSCQFRGICFDEVQAVGKKQTEKIRSAMAVQEPSTPQRVSTILKRKSK